MTSISMLVRRRVTLCTWKGQVKSMCEGVTRHLAISMHAYNCVNLYLYVDNCTNEIYLYIIIYRLVVYFVTCTV